MELYPRRKKAKGVSTNRRDAFDYRQWDEDFAGEEEESAHSCGEAERPDEIVVEWPEYGPLGEKIRRIWKFVPPAVDGF
jgi:hypothetical protein